MTTDLRTTIGILFLLFSVIAQAQDVLAPIPPPTVSSSDTFLETRSWNLPVPMYGQLKLVPSVQGPDAAIENWHGPWQAFQTFKVEFGYGEGEAPNPKYYRFVEPRVTIDGLSDKTEGETEEGFGLTVRLFDTASTVGNIHVTLSKLPTPLHENVEYKVATINGVGASLKWDVYVRFLTNKPEYVHDKR
jgi:hypothetical protein